MPGVSVAQSYNVVLHSADNNDEVLKKNVPVPKSFALQGDAGDFIQNIVPRLQEKGYLAASVDSVGGNSTQYEVYVFAGRQYKWARIMLDSVPQAMLTAAAVNPLQWQGQPLQPNQLSRLSEKLLAWCDENGYPFARINMQDVIVDDAGGVYGRLRIDRGAPRRLDSIEVSGSVRISKNYLMRYLDLKEGELYNEKKLRNVSPRLRELPFLQEAAPWSVAFKLSETRLNLRLAERKANQLNAIIGLLPNSSETGKFLLTADVQFAFQNILAAGESISVSYQNLQYRSPNLKADLAWPYLFDSPLGLDGHFELYKKDTSFRRTQMQAGIRYQLTATDYVRVFYQNQSSRLITIDTNYVRNFKKLPDNADVAANGAGIELVINRTDYRISPRKGWQVRFSSSALLRSIRKNDAITGLTDGSGFDYASLYDSLEERKYQYHITGDAAYYFPLGKKATFKAGYSGGWISGNNLFRNELFQIGGFKLLRGFDEQSIYANQFHVAIAELRLLLSQNSYVYLFSDNAYVTSHFNGVHNEGWYNGFGLGTTLETKSGLFTISYALGRSDMNPVQFRQSKIHFGYVAYF